MTQWFDIGQEAQGVIAVGQIATGVIAIGQMATGVIAIGQVARGGIAVGMGAMGLVSVGMGAVGVFHCTAMMGLGGSGFGLVIPLVPGWPKKSKFPSQISLKALQSGSTDAGWIRVGVEPTVEGPELRAGGETIPVRFTSELWPAARRFGTEKHGKVLAYVERRDEGLVCTRLMRMPRRSHWRPAYWGMGLAQLAGLAGISLVWWLVAGKPVLDFVLALTAR